MRTAIAWFAENRVAANLLMILIITGGAISIKQVRREVFPSFSTDTITVSVAYLGAAPEEVEEAICSRIEERLLDLESVKKIRSVAAEGVGVVTVELLAGTDASEALDEVKSRIDAIETFPEESEKPIIQEIKLRSQVLSLAISGDADPKTLKRIAETVRDDLSALDGITQVDLTGTRPYEVAIEVSEKDLRQWGLTFDQVVAAVRRSSLDLPGGTVKSSAGEILLRTTGQAYDRRQFEDLLIVTREDGTRLLLGDIATVVDGFAETDQAARFDGKPAALVQVFRVGDQDVTEIADLAKSYVAESRSRLPEGIELTIWQDDTRVLHDRLDTLLRNGRAGLFLVLLVLALFLRLRLAGFVAVGIVVSFLGAFWVMPTLDLSINMISLFAFIVVLGIVVDDAIVVGENIFRHFQQGKVGLQAAVEGTHEVAIPVIFSVLTTVAAFAPLTAVPGTMGKIMRVIPLIVISTLLFSLVESLLVLPAHLSHLRSTPKDHQAPAWRRAWQRFQRSFSSGFDRFTLGVYEPLLARALRWRYTTIAVGLALLMLTMGYIISGRLRFSFFPAAEADNLVAYLTMPQGTAPEVTAAALERLEASAHRLQAELTEQGESDAFRHVLTSIGDQPFRARQNRLRPQLNRSAAHLGEVSIELAPAEERSTSATLLQKRWRELTGSIPDAVELSFVSSLLSAGDAVNIQLAGPDLDNLRTAAQLLQRELTRYPGVTDISDSFRAGKRQIELDISAEGEALGLTRSDLAKQVRQAFYGDEAQRIQRGRDDVRVMVRYPRNERRTLASLEGMRLRTPTGDEVPFSIAARTSPGRGYAAIERTDQRRTVNVTADVDSELANSNEILADVQQRVLPTLAADFRGLSFSLEGEQQEQRDMLDGLKRGFIMALVVIYALLAVPFRSYFQPLIVMSAIPFGLIGAAWGHVLMGKDLTLLSGFGIVALTGVVVNDSLVLVDFINRAHRAGAPLQEALIQAARQRCRPIVLTSMTTFAGLLPLLLEKSMQAQFLIPMAISLAFGVLFSTAIILVLVPVCYHVLEDIEGFWRRSKSLPHESDELTLA